MALLVNSISPKKAFRLYYRACLIVAVAFSVAILLFGKWNLVVVSALGFTLFILAFRWIFRMSTDPFMLIFLTFSMVYIELPIVLMASRYPDYFPTDGLNLIPVTPSAIILAQALAMLAIFYIASFCAIKAIVVKNHVGYSLPSFLKHKTAPFIAIALIVYGEIYDNLFSVFVTKVSGNIIGELSRFITNDAALFTAMFLILNHTRVCRGRPLSDKTTLLYYLLTGGYIIYRTISGSKGVTIIIFSLAFIYPLALLGRVRGQKILLPSPIVAISMLTILPVTYVFGLIFRLARNYGDRFTFSEACSYGLENLGTISLLIEAIGDRLSTAFNRYILIFSNYYENGFTDSVKALPRYFFENLLNLLLPGTPFPDCYYMSSMQLEKILLNEPFISGDIAQLLASLNTQPFTAFGICILFAGVLGPMLFFLFIVILRLLYNKTKFWGSLFTIILFDLTLSCYGLDPAVQNAFVWLCTMLFLSFLTRATAGKSNLVNVKD